MRIVDFLGIVIINFSFGRFMEKKCIIFKTEDTGNKRRDRDRARQSAGPAADNAYYAQLTTGQTMRNNILVCDANNSIIASKWEIRTQFALHRTVVDPLYISHFHCITYYYTLARAPTHPHKLYTCG